MFVFFVDVKGRIGYMFLDVVCWELEVLGRIRMLFFCCFFFYKVCS